MHIVQKGRAYEDLRKNMGKTAIINAEFWCMKEFLHNTICKI